MDSGLSSCSKHHTTPGTYHTYNKNIFTIFGFLHVVTNPRPYYILNLMLLVFLNILYAYLFILTIWTAVSEWSNSESGDLIRLLTQTCLEIPASTMGIMMFCTRKKVLASFRTLETGVFQYQHSEKSHDEIKKKRVKQILLSNSILTCSCLIFMIGSAVFPAIVQLTTRSSQVSSDSRINPYLPFPIYTPFNTRNVLGYVVAFLSHFVLLFFLNMILIITLGLHVSFTLQFVAQIEILNESLRNIEKRAYLMLLNNKLPSGNNKSFSKISYADPEFKNCLYFCLRENILHHHAILRLKVLMADFFGGEHAHCLIFFSIAMAASLVAIIENPRENISLLALIAVECAGFFPICLVGQIVTDESAETTRALYSTPWPHCNKNFNKLLNIMLTSSQKPVVLTAFGSNGPKISLQTFGDMVTLGYKIVSILR